MYMGYEFTDAISEENILKQLEKMTFHQRYITHHFSAATYPIQNIETRTMIQSLKRVLALYNIYFTGRFADWEYYNMDVAIAAAFATCKLMK